MFNMFKKEKEKSPSTLQPNMGLQAKPQDFIGYTLTDVISGFKGTCTGYSEYITGCAQILLADDEDSKWFDAQRLHRHNDIAKLVLDNSSNPGCDLQAPTK